MHVTIYTKPGCNYCVKAKQFLNQRGMFFEEIKIGDQISREQLLLEFPTARTAPVITIDGQYIGGFDELVQYASAAAGSSELLLG